MIVMNIYWFLNKNCRLLVLGTFVNFDPYLLSRLPACLFFFSLLFICFMVLNKSKLLQSFVGHGDSVNEIRTQALRPSLVLSASKVSLVSSLLFECVVIYVYSKTYMFVLNRMNPFACGMFKPEFAF